MAATTYCVQADVNAVLSEAGVRNFADDNDDGSNTTTETSYVTRAIERGAGKMNSILDTIYKLSDLSGNEWCRDCNAAIAAKLLAGRRGNPVPESLVTDCDEYMETLKEIQLGQQKVPGINPSFNNAPTTTNYRPEIGKREMPIRVDVQDSTGESPEGNRKRRVAHERGW